MTWLDEIEGRLNAAPRIEADIHSPDMSGKHGYTLFVGGRGPGRSLALPRSLEWARAAHLIDRATDDLRRLLRVARAAEALQAALDNAAITHVRHRCLAWADGSECTCGARHLDEREEALRAAPEDGR